MAELIVSGDAMRLDRFLVAHGASATSGRRNVAALVATGGVRVNGRRARKGTIVRAGDVVTVEPPRHAAVADTAGPLVVLLADDGIVAVDKPPGLPTTIGRTSGPSLAAMLVARYPEMAALDPTHGGLVHRLDTGTSGVLVAARTPAMHARLRAAFTTKRVRKEYLAVVVGRLTERTTVDRALSRRPRSRGRMIVARGPTRAWPARSDVLPIGGDDELTLVRLGMRTGVTHQLRVHLATIGHPILGDRRYGAALPDPELTDVSSTRWHFLHARAIGFDDEKLPTRITAPFPAHWRPLFTARRWSLAIAGDDR